MATTYTDNLGLPLPAITDEGWGATLLALFAKLDALAPIAAGCVTLSETPSASLNVDVAACVYRKADDTLGTYAGVAGHAVPASATTCLYLTNAGVLTHAASVFPTGSPIVRLSVVVAGASTITSVTDARVVLGATS